MLWSPICTTLNVLSIGIANLNGQRQLLYRQSANGRRPAPGNPE
jgi:hypothetical protein